MNRLALFGLGCVCLFASFARSQTATKPARPAIPLTSSGRVVIPDDMPPELVEMLLQAQAANGGVANAPGVVDEAPTAKTGPSIAIQEFRKLKFDRRPSAIFEEWAKPEPDEKLPEYPEPPAAVTGDNAKQPPVEEQKTEPANENAENAESGTTESTEGMETPPDEVTEEPPVKTTPPNTPVVSKAATDEAQAKDQYEAKRTAVEKQRVTIQQKQFVRDVTLGRWEAVKAYLATLEKLKKHEGKQAYQHLMRGLLNPPPAPRKSGMPNIPQLNEKNAFTFQDVLLLLAACPVALDNELVDLAPPLLRLAIDAGHVSEELVATLKAQVELEGERRIVGRRHAALLLFGVSLDTEAGPFLPTFEQAETANDREGLNLLSRYHLALYGKEKLPRHLENAWRVTQAVLAQGEVQAEAKAEALQRAVELAPKVREELGAAWLNESFQERPERGVEILATIGSQAARGIQDYGYQVEFRLKSLQLQKTAVDALLAKAPERAQEWRDSLVLLANNWLQEANFSYTYSGAESLGRIMRRDSYGNMYYVNYGSSGMRSPGNVQAIETPDVLSQRPGDAWLALLPASMQPRYAVVTAQLLLKVNEEREAFPYIERLASAYPAKAQDLVNEFVRVWIKNNNPNAAQDMTNSYMFMYGFDQRANAIPLTRSKQERALKDLSQWVARIRKLPIAALDEALLARAFTASHSQAEVYKLESIEDVFGPVKDLEPKTIASLAQQMRRNLASVWRKPATQDAAKTRRKPKDIEREVLRGYEVANAVVDGALARHDHEWSLVQAKAALMHDELNFRHEIQKTSEFSAQRQVALELFARGVALYAEDALERASDEESAEPYLAWFYASLGASDLQAVNQETRAALGEMPKIQAALAALPGESAERHLGMFANSLFTRMSAVNPSVKFRYLRAGFDIVGEHEQAYEARKVFQYYQDLVTEVRLETTIDGSDQVGQEPFGVFVNLKHTAEIERESGGFGKYLQNQNSQNFSYNYGRPTEDYRDKFEEFARTALSEHFEVQSITFNEPSVRSKALDEYGWRVTPYAYLLLKAHGPEVDTLPSLQLDLDFLDTSGYAVLPIESPAVPLDAAHSTGTLRPVKDLAITQILDERQSEEGKLVLEVKAQGHGLVPRFDEMLQLGAEDFEVLEVEDKGCAVSRFDPESPETAVLCERNVLVTLQAKEGLAKYPEHFAFAGSAIEGVQLEFLRYADADLTACGSIVDLVERYGEPERTPWWPFLVGGAFVLALLAVFLLRKPAPVVYTGDLHVPENLTPFTALGLLRAIERRNGIAPDGQQELRRTIEQLELYYFEREDGEAPDLRRMVERWIQRAR
ncbi:MAG: hypothetical protein H6833_06140 [Planctomycetes bacterium]|nr:hypothetical protein [Planctomycetota bacterium]